MLIAVHSCGDEEKHECVLYKEQIFPLISYTDSSIYLPLTALFFFVSKCGSLTIKTKKRIVFRGVKEFFFFSSFPCVPFNVGKLRCVAVLRL